MRGILIDPVKREVTVIDVAKGLDGLYAAVFGEGKRGYVELVRIDGSIDLWVDEEGLLKPWEEQAFFRFRGTDRPFAGRGVLLGGDDGTGESMPAPQRLTAELVASRVEWVEPKDVRVPAPRWTIRTSAGLTTLTRTARCTSW